MVKHLIPISKGVVEYDPSCPSGLRWNKSSKYRPEKVGLNAGNKNLEGYWKIQVQRGVSKPSSHVIWNYFNPNDQIDGKFQIDHLDGNTDNNSIENLRKVLSSTNSRNKGKYNNNTSGVTGVKLLTNKAGNRYYSASFHSVDKKRKTVYFSIDKLGEELAFKQACELRKSMLDLGILSEGYTERHGN